MVKLEGDVLAEVLDILESHKGRHTELITVYVSAGYDANAVQKQLEGEISTAKNIKSTGTRKNVTEALEKIIRYLKSLNRTPENGLALFAGNVSPTEGQDDLRLWDIEPPLPLKIRMYRCDKDFVTQPLREMLDIDEVFGLLVMDRKDAAIGILEGKRIETLQKMSSGVPSKVRAGGQCLHKSSLVETDKGLKKIYEIKIGDKLKAFDFNKNKIVFTKVKNKWENIRKSYRIIVTHFDTIICSNDHTFFVKDENNKIKEIFAGALTLNNLLINSDFDNVNIDSIIENKQQIELIDIETEEGNFFANNLLVHNSSQRFHRITEGLTKEFYKRIADEMKTLFYDRPKLKGVLIGGPIPTKDEFIDGEYLPTKLQSLIIARKDLGYADEHGLKLLVESSQDVLASQGIIKEKKLLEKFFNTLGKNPGLVVYKPDDVRKALEYGAVEILVVSKSFDKNIAKELKEIAHNTSSEVEIVSTETPEGEQFYNLSGIGAILRFAIN